VAFFVLRMALRGPVSGRAGWEETGWKGVRREVVVVGWDMVLNMWTDAMRGLMLRPGYDGEFGVGCLGRGRPGMGRWVL
jgi:hypothetical protein